ncbi:MAG: hypothetical protein GY944_02850 [bacterium]|nr:hypothetical protein [bacterium]
MSERVHVFGIRHHGPGSARSLLRALEELAPDRILIEGPPDANDLIPFVADRTLVPPVALLCYAHGKPQHSVFYPFAEHSPEWQALRYATTMGVDVEFMDLPQAHRLGVPELEPEPKTKPNADAEAPGELEGEAEPETRSDPLGMLAQVAGYEDGEQFWERLVEQRGDDLDVFAAICELMTEARSVAADAGVEEAKREQQREAYMRKVIKKAVRDGAERIAVVCGAWHAPVLSRMPPAKGDQALLKALPKTKVVSTWVPWTQNRLAWNSGYGAGVASPGFYQHLWDQHDHSDIHWLARVARELRTQGLDASSASVIETQRLAHALSALRGRTEPGLIELQEASQSVLAFGDAAPLALVHRRLVVGECMGSVPDNAPAVPLQQDLTATCKKLRLKPEAVEKDHKLDLRKDSHLARSHLLHRLNLLGITWGQLREGRGKGTFWELWRLQWHPEFAVSIVEASVFGNSVETAAENRARATIFEGKGLAPLTKLLRQLLLAELPAVVPDLVTALEQRMALSSDTSELMTAVPPLAEIGQYGDVRQTDKGSIDHLLHGLVARITVGLPQVCRNINEDAATTLRGQLDGMHHALHLLEHDELLKGWHDVLERLCGDDTVHGLLRGRMTRILMDAAVLDSDGTARVMSRACSAGATPEEVAAWVEGFLSGSGLVLLHDDVLWAQVDQWLCSLTGDAFKVVVPLLRRCFSTFEWPERRQMAERVTSGGASAGAVAAPAEDHFDRERGNRVLPGVGRFLGLDSKAIGELLSEDIE